MKVVVNAPVPTPATYDIIGLTEDELDALRFAMLSCEDSSIHDKALDDIYDHIVDVLEPEISH